MNFLLLFLLSFSLHAEVVRVKLLALSEQQAKEIQLTLNTQALISRGVVFQKNKEIEFESLDWINDSQIKAMLKPSRVWIREITRSPN